MSWNPLVVALPFGYFVLRAATAGFTTRRTIGPFVVGIWFAMSVIDRLAGGRLTDWIYAADRRKARAGQLARPGTAPANAESTRQLVRGLLALLADPQAPRTYENDVPVAVPAELLRTWFDDICRHPDGERFREAFTPAELTALAAFHERYRAAADEIGPAPATVAELQALPAWGRVMRGADEALRAVPCARSRP